MRVTKQLPADIHYAIIKCDDCGKDLAKLFRDCQGCYVNETVHCLCDKCWNRYLGK